ncbi:MAG: DNA primase [Bacteroidetes bacterium]|nr:DNA primase [Bacteroidota bacterium]MCK4360402.1 DNA primase [Bacteroidales bacterium]
MISPETISAIFETARIEEVIGDFVNIKKRGVNYIGLCPFHNEKTPSFTVSPSKGIYKCFGCGKGGNSVNFIMEHERYSYPEALKYLAKKYNIEIEEEEQTPEQLQALDEQEGLYFVSTFAQKYFTENLFKKDEGKAIGLTYFKERDFTESTIKKFQLGYGIDKWDDFTQQALSSGYKIDYLIKTGLTISKENKHYDRFRGRVLFPIHNLSGKVIGFGGRILSSEKSKAKYVNSPESDIYNKSKVLYGIYFSRNAIINKNNCFLVEGYTDVISLHQAGIENVVASSGTSLTTDQIKLIKRYTPNITILYDGDEAGVKASFRGIDMILEEGMNVRIVLFPEGEDPDSYARNNHASEVQEFISKKAEDFISFKTNLLIKETKNDPIKKAALIKEIVKTIALIPDGIYRSVYVKECGSIMNVPEQTLMNELNRILRRKFRDKNKITRPEEAPEQEEYKAEKQIDTDLYEGEFQERDIIRLLLMYGNKEIIFEEINEDNQKIDVPVKVANFIVKDIKSDEIYFQNATYQLIFNEYESAIEKGFIPDEQYFINHADEKISQLTIELISSPYELSPNWLKKRILVKTEKDRLKLLVVSSVLSFKAKKVDKMIIDNQKEIQKASNDEDRIILQQKHISLKNISRDINRKLSRIIIK